MQIKITRLYRFESGRTKAMCDVELVDMGITINDIGIVENNKGEIFASLPSRKYNKDGVDKYRTYVGFPEKDKYWSFQNSIKDAYHSYGEGTQQSQPLPTKDEIAESTGSGYYTNTQTNVQRATPVEAAPSMTFGDDLPF